MSMIQVQCPCGDVKMELSGEPLAQVFCHCDDCRKAHGAAYVPVAIYPEASVKVTSGAPTHWAIKTTRRVTCGRCGTRLYQEPPGYGFRGVNATLLPPGQFKAALHQQCQHAVAPVRDELPHFKAFPPALGGSDERVGW